MICRFRFIFLTLFLLLSFSLHAGELSNPLEGSLQEGGQFGNSEVKFYTGDLGLFVRLPQYTVYGEPEVLSLTYRSQNADPWASILEERIFHHSFKELDVSIQFNQKETLSQRYEGFGFLDKSKFGYLFKAHFPASDLPTGFYPATISLNYTTFHGFCSLCSYLPWVGRYFGEVKQETESFSKEQFVLNSADSPYGAGWHFSMDERLYVSKEYIVKIMGDGSYTYYQKAGKDFYRGVGVAHGEVFGNSRGWYVTDGDGTHEEYDPDGKLLWKEDLRGRRTAWQYHEWGGIDKIIDPLGRGIVFTYDAANKLTQITDAVGRTTRLWIDPQTNNLTAIVFPDGSELKYLYDKNHHATTKSSPRGFKTHYAYDDYGKIKSVTDAVGATWKYELAYGEGSINEFNKSHNKAPLVPVGSLQSRFIDPMGGVTEYTFQRIPFVWKTVDALGRITETIRDSRGQITEEIQPNGNRLTYKYDDNGNRTEVQNEGSKSLTKFFFNKKSQITSIADGEGNLTQFTYDSDGNLVMYKNAEDETTVFDYNTNGQLIRQTAPNGGMTRYEYDSAGNLAKTIDALGNETTHFYDSYGNLTKTISPSGVTQKYAYDVMNRLLWEENSSGGKTTYNYAEAKCDCSSNNLATSITDALGNTTVREYDGIGQLTKIADPLGNATLYGYTKNRQLASVTDALGRIRNFEYDAENQLTQIDEPNKTTIKFAYTPLGNLKTLKDGKDQTTTFKYDPAGRMTEEVDAEDHSTKYVYNRTDQLLKTLYPDESQVSYTYDRTGRLLKREGLSVVPPPLMGGGQGAGGPGVKDFTHFRYQDGNLIYAENEDAKITRSYDLLNRLIEEQTDINAGPTHKIAYDYAKDQLTQTHFADQQIQYVYNTTGFLKNILSSSDCVAFDYDPLGRRQRMAINGKLVKTYAYDENSRLTSLAYSLNQKPVFQQTLQYNLVNNITQLAQNDGETRYDYDELDQLTQARGPKETEQFSYDKAGSHLFNPKTPAEYSPTNAIISNPAEQASYEHDKMGRMTHVQESVKTMELAWNSRSQLKQATVDGKKVVYLYDPFGRRIGKIFSDGTREYYGYDREDIVAVYDANSLKNTFLHGPGIDEPLVSKDKNKKNIYVADYLGSVREILGDDGKPVAEYDYESFGKRRVLQEIKNKLISTAYAYTGREWDGETGWYYYRNRHYSGQDRHLVTRDPIYFNPSLNLYAYVQNNPLKFTDPTGLQSTISTQNSGPYATATSNGNNVDYLNSQGLGIQQSGGSRSWRNNNPGNIRSSPNQIGTAGGFAVFADYQTGYYDITRLLQTSNYRNLSIYNAVSRWAPPAENDTTNYQNLVRSFTGLDSTRLISSLNQAELNSVASAIQRIEGYSVGTVTAIPSCPIKH